MPTDDSKPRFIEDLGPPEAARPPRRNRKTRRWNIQAGPIATDVSEEALRSGEALALLSSTRGRGALGRKMHAATFEAVLEAESAAREGRPRGRNAAPGQGSFSAALRYTAAYAYELARSEMKIAASKRHPAVKKLLAKLDRTDIYKLAPVREKPLRLALRMVMNCFPLKEWARHGRKPPKNIESFERHWLKTGRERAQVKRALRRNPNLAYRSAWLRPLLEGNT
jgi:hypothetical protein